VCSCWTPTQRATTAAGLLTARDAAAAWRASGHVPTPLVRSSGGQGAHAARNAATARRQAMLLRRAVRGPCHLSGQPRTRAAYLACRQDSPNGGSGGSLGSSSGGGG
jgi:hypothetical protein